jgi:hypothetical protein
MRKVLTLVARSKLEAIDALNKAIKSLKNDVDYNDTNIDITVSVPDDNNTQ